MKSVYKLVIDNGKIFEIKAKTREKAIDEYCKMTGVSKEWV